MRSIKTFNTLAEYQEWIASVQLTDPIIALDNETGMIHFFGNGEGPVPPGPTPSGKIFTFTYSDTQETVKNMNNLPIIDFGDFSDLSSAKPIYDISITTSCDLSDPKYALCFMIRSQQELSMGPGVYEGVLISVTDGQPIITMFNKNGNKYIAKSIVEYGDEETIQAAEAFGISLEVTTLQFTMIVASALSGVVTPEYNNIEFIPFILDTSTIQDVSDDPNIDTDLAEFSINKKFYRFPMVEQTIEFIENN